MPSFEFHGATAFASCQYDAEEFFVAVQEAAGDFPQLARAQLAFEALHDEVFSFSKGETAALKHEVSRIVEILKIDLEAPVRKYAVFGVTAQQMDAVFSESEDNETDIQFRWG